MAEMPDSRSESSGRKSRGDETGARVRRGKGETVRPETSQLMEAVVARENLLRAYAQVMSNKGAAGIDAMPVEQLKPYLQGHSRADQSRPLEGRVSTAAGTLRGDTETTRRSAAI